MCITLGAEMRRGRQTATLVLGAFAVALTVLPWLHTLNHRDDHVHVDGAIVFLAHGEDHDHDHHHHPGADGDDDDADNDDDADDAQPGFDHPAHHGPHGRGALAHGSAFILAGAIFVVPPPAVDLERLPPPASPERPALVEQRSPRVTRGPPQAT
jgi:hypothetical protein